MGNPGRWPGGLVKPTVPRFAVIAPNWLGDAVMALPAIADIRRAVPEASLAIIARPTIAPVFSMVPGIDEVVVLATKGGRESFWNGHDKDSSPILTPLSSCPTRFMRR